jgi:hypothetical protein
MALAQWVWQGCLAFAEYDKELGAMQALLSA